MNVTGEEAMERDVEVRGRQPSIFELLTRLCHPEEIRRRYSTAMLVLAGLGTALLLTGGSALADEVTIPQGSILGSASPASPVSPTLPPQAFKICTNQTYALCAVAKCFVFNGVAYCKCDVKSGDSISSTFNFGTDQDVCTANAEGAKNGYIVSTFSVPESVVAPNGNKALYNCRAKTSDGAYAQCDGGICFTSTEGQSFPGFDKPLGEHKIMCSCPITVADPATAKLGFQIAGPYPCQASYFENCTSAVANTKTGSTVYVGAPTGSARVLAQMLNGSVPPLNKCISPRN
jgi:hypothetical protein